MGRINRRHPNVAVQTWTSISRHQPHCGVDHLQLPFVCWLCSFRYEDAVSKYEAVMKTEPNVAHFTLLAKERMCHALAKVRPRQAGRRGG